MNADTNVSLRSELCMLHDALILCFIEMGDIIVIQVYRDTSYRRYVS